MPKASTAADAQPSTVNKRKPAPKYVFTVGYQGYTAEEFIAHLLDSAIEQLLDVRCNAISRKKGFSKNQLRAACEAAGIAYVHLPELGIPTSYRGKLNTPADYAALFATYLGELLPAVPAAVAQAAALIQARPSALMCFEQDTACCHRTPLAQKLAEMTGMKIKYI